MFIRIGTRARLPLSAAFVLSTISLANVDLNGNIILIIGQVPLLAPLLTLAASAFLPALHSEPFLVCGPKVLETVCDMLIELSE